MIVTGAMILGYLLAITRMPYILAGYVTLPLPPHAIIGVIILVYLVGGCFMDVLAIYIHADHILKHTTANKGILSADF